MVLGFRATAGRATSDPLWFGLIPMGMTVSKLGWLSCVFPRSTSSPGLAELFWIVVAVAVSMSESPDAGIFVTSGVSLTVIRDPIWVVDDLVLRPDSLTDTRDGMVKGWFSTLGTFLRGRPSTDFPSLDSLKEAHIPGDLLLIRMFVPVGAGFKVGAAADRVFGVLFTTEAPSV